MKKQNSKKMIKGLSIAFICGSLMLTSCSTATTNWLPKDSSSTKEEDVKDYSRLLAPSGLTFNESTSTIEWNTVYGASGYTININGKEIKKNHTKNSYEYHDFAEGEAYLISVKAIGSKDKTLEDSVYSSIYYNKKMATSDFAYRLAEDGSTIEITGFRSSADVNSFETFTLPSEIDGYTVSRIAEDAFRRNSTIKEITLPSTIKSIGKSAFQNTRFNKINLNEGLIAIEDFAFENSRVSEISFPQSLQTLGVKSFNGVTQLKTVNFHIDSVIETIPESCFASCGILELTLPASVKTVDKFAFSSLASLKTLNFGHVGRKSKLEVIEESGFEKLVALKSIVLPASLKRIGLNAFQMNSGTQFVFESIMFEAGSKIEILETGAFQRTLNSSQFKYFGPEIAMDQLPTEPEMILPASLKEIGEKAFTAAKATKISFEEGSVLTTIGEQAFSLNSELVSIQLPASLQSIKANAFTNCLKLANVELTTLNSQLVEVDSTAFASTPWYNEKDKIILNNILIKDNTTDSITELVVDDGIKYIANNVYAKKNFTSIKLPNTLIGIYAEAFAENTNITSIIIPSSVTYIGKSAFKGCSKVDTLTFEANSKLEIIDDYAFAQLDKRVESNTETIVFLTAITLPASVKKIGNNAFFENTNITQFNIEANSQLESIGDYAFASLNSLKQFNIPSSVKSIGNNAFEGSTGNVSQLESIIFESNSQLETIGDYAFSRLSKLNNFILPDSVKLIGESAFQDTSSLSNFVIHSTSQLEEVHRNAFYSSVITSFYVPETIKILDAAFPDAVKLTNITFAENAFIHAEEANRTIFKFTFNNCSSLTQIHLPKYIQKIEENAFNGCANLINITSFAEEIDSNAFNGTGFISSFSDGLVYLGGVLIRYTGTAENVIIPDGITHINASAFKENKTIQSIVFPDSLESIGASSFENCTSLARIDISNQSNLQTIEKAAFANCSALQSFNFTTNLAEIGAYSFVNCENLTKANLYNTKLKTIPFAAFANCSQLSEMYLPQMVETIESAAFFKNKLNNVNILNSVQTIGDYAFAFNEETNNSFKLTSFVEETALEQIQTYINNSIKNSTLNQFSINSLSFGSASQLNKIGRYAFAGNKIENLRLSTKLTIEVKEYAFSYSMQLKEAYLANSLSLELGVLSNSNAITHLSHSGNVTTFTLFGPSVINVPRTLEKITILEGSTSLNNHAFNGLSFLKEVELPDTITKIGDSAFYGCREITSINLKNVEEIGNEAFYGCQNLETIEYSKQLKTIGNKAFMATKWLRNATQDFVEMNGILILYQGNDQVVTLPNNIVAIAGGAFSGNQNVTKIIASENLMKIGEGAFDNATSLKDLVLVGNHVVDIAINIFDTLASDFKVEVSNKQNYIENNILWALYSDYIK